MRVKLYGYLGGMAGTDRTIRTMQRLVTDGRTHPDIVFLAQQLSRKRHRKDYAGRANEIFHWVQRNIHYVEDPVDTELLRTPDMVLKFKAGDCDDQAILFSALCQAVGLRTRFKAIKANKDKPRSFSHVYSEVQIPNVGWVPADTIVEKANLGWEAPHTFGSRVWEGDLGMMAIDMERGVEVFGKCPHNLDRLRRRYSPALVKRAVTKLALDGLGSDIDTGAAAFGDDIDTGAAAFGQQPDYGAYGFGLGQTGQPTSSRRALLAKLRPQPLRRVGFEGMGDSSYDMANAAEAFGDLAFDVSEGAEAFGDDIDTGAAAFGQDIAEGSEAFSFPFAGFGASEPLIPSQFSTTPAPQEKNLWGKIGDSLSSAIAQGVGIAADAGAAKLRDKMSAQDAARVPQYAPRPSTSPEWLIPFAVAGAALGLAVYLKSKKGKRGR